MVRRWSDAARANWLQRWTFEGQRRVNETEAAVHAIEEHTLKLYGRL
jgi:hypothetical protein